MKLVIVESPAKARTIEKFLGPDFRVEASYGHIRDLPSSASEIPSKIRAKPWGRLAVDVETDFTPHYIVPKENQKRVKELRKIVAGADEVLLATDEDREGESISWHLQEVLEPKVPVRRITFHEITKQAILESLDNPREVDERLVRAQETRRVLDRLFGYSLSPVLWKKVRTKLSAGRVQSVALRLVVEREEERQRFQRNEYWDVQAVIGTEAESFPATLTTIAGVRLVNGKDFDATTGAPKSQRRKIRHLGQDEAVAIALAAAEARPWTVARLEQKRNRQRPAPPFITSTLQQAASSRLRMSPKQTMSIAQRLYEGVGLGGGERQGLITYMRTDSLTLSEKALQDAADYIRRVHGEEFYQGVRVYRTKSKSAQEAHEAIRPTEMGRTPESLTKFLEPNELSLYRLIWERAVASQMADAQLDNTTADLAVQIDSAEHLFRATGSILRFPGFLALAGGRREDVRLPPLEEGQDLAALGLELLAATPDQHETRPPARYTEATLVKKLEAEGIGRPSTYTPTISTIQDRDYVVKKSGYLIPTYLGMAVTHLLRAHFSTYVDVAFTARLESKLDDIAEGREDWIEFLSNFYRGSEKRLGLERQIETELPNIDFPTIPIGTDPETGEPIQVRIGRRSFYVQRADGGEGNTATIPVDLLIDELDLGCALELIERRSKSDEPLGVDDATGLDIYLKVGPYGPYLQLGQGEGKAKPKRVSLPRGTSPEDVTLEAARELLSLPRTVGVDPASGKPVTAGLGRYGPYVERAGTYQNIASVAELFTITLEDAVARLDAKGGGKKTLKELGPHPESGVELKILSGRYGPYVTDGKLNASLPRGTEVESVDLTRAVELLAERAKRPARPRRRRKKS